MGRPRVHRARAGSLARACVSRLSRVLREPAAGVLVAVDADVAARLEDDLEITAIDWLLGPPAVDDAPLLRTSATVSRSTALGAPSKPGSTSAGRGAFSRPTTRSARGTQWLEPGEPLVAPGAPSFFATRAHLASGLRGNEPASAADRSAGVTVRPAARPHQARFRRTKLVTRPAALPVRLRDARPRSVAWRNPGSPTSPLLRAVP